MKSIALTAIEIAWTNLLLQPRVLKMTPLSWKDNFIVHETYSVID